MQAPVSMLGAAGGSTAAIVIAVLVGLYIVSTLKKPPGQSAATGPR